ncbi:alcohol dehydrogenase catalytic domain-containing protein [Streptomyces sp. GMR22]|uniref:alcohol dehydrogenase catalytic domain-containing protein n=1 Tax=Streptomyces sp. GMR22 TaxID=2759524 RepID=UPI001F2C485B|nr:alcohol dehydrogenase catalytic domain-containing protein [Streptomyces sp. GMR22]
MQAITVQDRDAGVSGLILSDVPHPRAAENDVIVEVHAAGFTPGELDWPGTWTDRAGRDRTPTVPGHELSGVVTELGYGTTGLTVGQRVFGVTDWARNGSLAQYTAVEARNLAPLPADVDHLTAAALPISGLTAWQALFDHAQWLRCEGLERSLRDISSCRTRMSPGRRRVRGHSWPTMVSASLPELMRIEAAAAELSRADLVKLIDRRLAPHDQAGAGSLSTKSRFWEMCSLPSAAWRCSIRSPGSAPRRGRPWPRRSRRGRPS